MRETTRSDHKEGGGISGGRLVVQSAFSPASPPFEPGTAVRPAPAARTPRPGFIASRDSRDAVASGSQGPDHEADAAVSPPSSRHEGFRSRADRRSEWVMQDLYGGGRLGDPSVLESNCGTAGFLVSPGMARDPDVSILRTVRLRGSRRLGEFSPGVDRKLFGRLRSTEAGSDGFEKSVEPRREAPRGRRCQPPALRYRLLRGSTSLLRSRRKPPGDSVRRDQDLSGAARAPTTPRGSSRPPPGGTSKHFHAVVPDVDLVLHVVHVLECGVARVRGPR